MRCHFVWISVVEWSYLPCECVRSILTLFWRLLLADLTSLGGFVSAPLLMWLDLPRTYNFVAAFVCNFINFDFTFRFTQYHIVLNILSFEPSIPTFCSLCFSVEPWQIPFCYKIICWKDFQFIHSQCGEICCSFLSIRKTILPSTLSFDCCGCRNAHVIYNPLWQITGKCWCGHAMNWNNEFAPCIHSLCLQIFMKFR